MAGYRVHAASVAGAEGDACALADTLRGIRGNWDAACRDGSSALRGCIDVYTEAITSADTATGVLADVAGKARAAAGVAGGLGAADAVVLAGETVRRHARRRASTGAELLGQAGSTPERAYLLKAVAAGHSGAESERFARTIRGRPPDWLHSHLTLLDRGGAAQQERFGSHRTQQSHQAGDGRGEQLTDW
jgi:hypothetical protein